MKLDDERSEGNPDQPPPPKYLLPVTVVTAAITCAAVITAEILWPSASPAISDGINVFHVVVSAAVLSMRRRKR